MGVLYTMGRSEQGYFFLFGSPEWGRLRVLSFADQSFIPSPLKSMVISTSSLFYPVVPLLFFSPFLCEVSNVARSP